MPFLSVLLIEDEAFTRTLLSAALTSSIIEVHAGHTAKFALEAAQEFNTEVAILDLDLGVGPTGIDIAHALRKINPRIGLILLTSYSDPRLSSSSGVNLPVGTRYITKSSLEDINLLVTVILRCKSRPLVVDRDLPSTRNDLTDHQIDIFRRIAGGASNSEIARLLSISDKAVENTITRINEVLGISRDPGLNPRVQLVRAYSTMSGKQLPS